LGRKSYIGIIKRRLTEGGEGMTAIDCKAIFNLQKQIIKAQNLTDAQKLKMLEDSINETLGSEKTSEEK
jgi:hypothetical protein